MVTLEFTGTVSRPTFVHIDWSWSPGRFPPGQRGREERYGIRYPADGPPRLASRPRLVPPGILRYILRRLASNPAAVRWGFDWVGKADGFRFTVHFHTYTR